MIVKKLILIGLTFVLCAVSMTACGRQDKIPEDLIAYISESLPKEREATFQVMTEMVSDRELTDEELEKLAEGSEDIQAALTNLTECRGYGCWVMVDADNDGIEDVFLQEYLGGSAGFIYYVLFKGTEEGKFSGREVGQSVRQEFAFIQWKGKNYLAMTTFDYNKKIYNGIQLTAYRDGQVSDTVWLQLTKDESPEAHEIKEVLPAKAPFDSLIRETMWNFNYIDESIQPKGSAEVEDKEQDNYHWSSDINNDGVTDRYQKSTWEPSNYTTYASLIFSPENISLEEQVYAEIGKEASVPLLMWVDETSEGNITYILYEDGLYDFHIVAYLFTEDGCERLMQVNHSFKMNVKIQRDTTKFEFSNLMKG